MLRGWGRYLISLGLLNVGALAYSQSLQGGDLEWIQSHRELLFAYLAFSVICHVLAVWNVLLMGPCGCQRGLKRKLSDADLASVLGEASWTAGKGKAVKVKVGAGAGAGAGPSSTPVVASASLKGRAAVVLLCAAYILVMMLMDTGNTLEHHGGYNALLFGFLYSVVMIACSAIWLSNMILGWKGAIVWWIFVAIAARFRARHVAWRDMAIWHQGVLPGTAMGLSDADQQYCSIKPQPDWIAITDGYMNKWTGSSSCEGVPELAAWGPKQATIVVNDRARGQWRERGCRIEAIPRTEKWNKKQKHTVTTWQSTIAELIQVVPVDPVTWTANATATATATIESFVVRCGEQSQLLVRAAINATAVQEKKEFWSARGGKAEAQQSVLVLYFDALSRRHFQRKFPETAAVIREIAGFKEGDADHHQTKTETDVRELFRYHSIAGYTVRNTVPQWAGRPHRERDSVKVHGDIMRRYSESGYVATHIDNSCQDWSMLYTQATSIIDHEYVAPFCDTSYYPPGDYHGNWVGPFSIRRRCLHGSHVHDHVFDYARSFWEGYGKQGVPRFAWLGFTEGHEGTGEVVGLIDPSAARFLRWCMKTGVFRDTHVWIASDHGLHMGLHHLLETPVSVQERFLPIWILMTPAPWLKTHAPALDSLKVNQQRVVTAFDNFATLEHIRQSAVEEAAKTSVSHLKPLQQVIVDDVPLIKDVARSLFNVIPGDRGCAGGGAEDMCMCSAFPEVP